VAGRRVVERVDDRQRGPAPDGLGRRLGEGALAGGRLVVADDDIGSHAVIMPPTCAS
jgi:hypothetical protein